MQFDLERYSSLLQCFDQTGRRVFGRDWTGKEAFAKPADDPTNIKQERESLVSRIMELEKEAYPYNRLLATDAGTDAFNAANAALYPIDAEIRDIKEALSSLPDTLNSLVTDFEAFTRRRKIEQILTDAFKAGDLNIVLGNSFVLDWKTMIRMRGFKLYFGLSMARVPKEYYSGPRHAPAFLNTTDFWGWLNQTFEPSEISGTKTKQAQAEAFLAEKVKTNKPKQFSKDEYREEAKALIPGLSDQAFDRAWAKVVPESWKSKGRKPRA